jgi:hypothetical protein
MRVPLAGTLRSVEISKDDGTLAEIGQARRDHGNRSNGHAIE